MTQNINNTEDQDTHGGEDPLPRLGSSTKPPLFNFRERPDRTGISTEASNNLKSNKSLGSRMRYLKSKSYWAGVGLTWLAVTYGTSWIADSLNIDLTASSRIDSPIQSPVATPTRASATNLPRGILQNNESFHSESREGEHMRTGISTDGSTAYQISIDSVLSGGNFGPESQQKLEALLSILNNKIDPNVKALLENSIVYIDYSVPVYGERVEENYTLQYDDREGYNNFISLFEVDIPEGFYVENWEITGDVLDTYLTSALHLSDGSEESISRVYALKLAIQYAHSQVEYENVLPEISSVLREDEYIDFREALYSPGLIVTPSNLN